MYQFSVYIIQKYTKYLFTFYNISQHFKILSIMQLVHWTTSSLYENTMRSVAQSELATLQWPTWDICQGETDLEHLKHFKCYFKNWRENLLFNSQATPAWEKSNRKSFKWNIGHKDFDEGGGGGTPSFYSICRLFWFKVQVVLLTMIKCYTNAIKNINECRCVDESTRSSYSPELGCC